MGVFSSIKMGMKRKTWDFRLIISNVKNNCKFFLMLLSSVQMIAGGRLLVCQERAAKTEVHGSWEVSSVKETFVTTA